MIPTLRPTALTNIVEGAVPIASGNSLSLLVEEVMGRSDLKGYATLYYTVDGDMHSIYVPNQLKSSC